MKSITDGKGDIPRSLSAADTTVIMGEKTTSGKRSGVGRKASAGGMDTPEAGLKRMSSISGGEPMTMSREREAEGADTAERIPTEGGMLRRKRNRRVPSTIGTVKHPAAGIPVSKIGRASCRERV